MIRYIAPIVLAVPLMAGALQISTQEHVSRELKPDVLQGSLGFEEQNKNINPIKEHLGAIVATLKRYDPKGEFCEGGGYQLSPRYNYANQKQEFIGYSGSLYFGCSFQTIEQYNELVAKLDSVTVSNVRKTQGALSWQVSEKNRLAAQQALRSELIAKARLQADSFSKDTARLCEIESIGFGGGMIPQPMMMRAMAMKADSVATESPIQSDETSALDANVVYTCTKN